MIQDLFVMVIILAFISLIIYMRKKSNKHNQARDAKIVVQYFHTEPQFYHPLPSHKIKCRSP